LSLVSVLLLIGIQGYWLLNQYEYVLDTYAEEITQQVQQAGNEEFLNRKGDGPLPATFQIRSNRDDGSNSRTNIIIGRLMPDMQTDENAIFMQREQPVQTDPRQIRPLETPNSFTVETNFIDSTKPYMDYFTNLTGEELRNAFERVVTNQMIQPFNQAQFDSILVSKLQTLNYVVIPWQEDEVYDHTNLWKRTGSVFVPRLTVTYAYSPLENKGIYISLKLPPQQALYRMGIQLMVSTGLTFLLIVCLIFQVRTIIKQRKVNEIRENFVNTMVHELKRPVQTLKSFVSFLKDTKMRSDIEATEQVVRDSMFELDNLTAYLNKLKDMLQADSETTALHPVRFNLHELVEKVIRLTHIPADKEVTISPFYETEDIFMEADPIHLANVLSNLIENAIKYSGDKVSVEIKIGQDKRKVYISVKDNGIGIPTPEQESVFTKFYRGNHIPDKNIPGIGLGLSYVKLIVEAHQGTINLDSQVGEGTTITICLP